MNQDERFAELVRRIEAAEALKSIPIPSELAQPSSYLKLLRASHHNWESVHFRKLFGMRFSVKLPPIEQLNVIAYPREDYDLPIFIFFCMLTKRKVIAHLNINCPFGDDAYRNEWVAPLTQILKRYPAFESDDRYPEWMLKYRNECTIYGLFPLARLGDISSCCFEYLDFYLAGLRSAKPVTDNFRLAEINQFHAQWVSDIRTQDKAQGMIAKMIGAKTARRIFFEVTT